MEPKPTFCQTHTAGQALAGYTIEWYVDVANESARKGKKLHVCHECLPSTISIAMLENGNGLVFVSGTVKLSLAEMEARWAR